MAKADIINQVSEEQGIDCKTIALVIEGFMKCVKNALGRGRGVFLHGFGTFSLKEEAAKKVQNIQQHITIYIPTRKVPHFKSSESFLSCRGGGNRKQVGRKSLSSVVRGGFGTIHEVLSITFHSHFPALEGYRCEPSLRQQFLMYLGVPAKCIQGAFHKGQQN